MALLDGIDSFLQSPQATALAASLLKSSGYSQTPITLGQALGQGMQDMEAAKVADMQNKMRKAELENYNEQAKERKQKNEARSKLMELYGTPSIPSPGVPYRNMPGTGLLGGELSRQDFMTRAAPLLLNMGEEKAALGMLGIGENNQPQYGQPVAGIDAQGRPVYFQADKMGNIRPIEGIMPIPKKGTSLITNSDGSIEFSQGGYDLGNGSMAPTTKVTNDLQSDIIKADESLIRLDKIAKNYSSTFLTYPGKARAWAGGMANKLLGIPLDKEYRKQYAAFTGEVRQFFNQYRKDITGAAASVKELEFLRDSLFNEDVDQVTFEARFNEFKNLTQRIAQAKAQVLAEGIKFGTREYGQRMDDLVIGGGMPSQTQEQTQATQQAVPAQAVTQQPTIRRYNPATGKIE